MRYIELLLIKFIAHFSSYFCYLEIRFFQMFFWTVSKNFTTFSNIPPKLNKFRRKKLIQILVKRAPGSTIHFFNCLWHWLPYPWRSRKGQEEVEWFKSNLARGNFMFLLQQNVFCICNVTTIPGKASYKERSLYLGIVRLVGKIGQLYVVN